MSDRPGVARLAPCPFCGNPQPDVIHWTEAGEDNWRVVCLNCLHSNRESEAAAVAAWNRARGVALAPECGKVFAEGAGGPRICVRKKGHGGASTDHTDQVWLAKQLDGVALAPPTLKPNQHKCPICLGSGIVRDAEPGEMVDV